MNTETKNINLPHTQQALADLSAALVMLENNIDQKKSVISAEKNALLKESNAQAKKLKELQVSSQNVVNTIDNIVLKLTKVLENDGSSNNNN